MLAACIAFTVLACTDAANPNEPRPSDLSLPGLIVSDAVGRAPSVCLNSSGNPSLSAGTSGASYVSHPPGAGPLEGFASVQIRTVTTDGEATRPFPVVDGGFDPIPVARVHDWSEDGKTLLLTMDNDVHLLDLETRATRRLTADGVSGSPAFWPMRELEPEAGP
jgi:hypothetical protein